MKTKVKNYNSRTEKDYNFWRSLYYQLFVVLVVMPVSKLMYNIKVEGRENVPKGSRLIFAGNHVSYLDPPMLTYAVHRRIAYMAKKELFESDNKLLKFLSRRDGTAAIASPYCHSEAECRRIFAPQAQFPPTAEKILRVAQDDTE